MILELFLDQLIIESDMILAKVGWHGLGITRIVVGLRVVLQHCVESNSVVGLGVDVIVMGLGIVIGSIGACDKFRVRIGMLTRIRSVVVTILFFVAGGVVMHVHELVLLQNWCIYW